MAQKDDATLLTQAGVIKAETTANANTATRVGTMMEDIIDSKMNNTLLIDEDDMSTNSATRVPSQQSVKAYVDAEVAGASGAVDSVNGATGVVVLDAGDIDFTPAGNIAATDVQAAIVELDNEKASISYVDSEIDAAFAAVIPEKWIQITDDVTNIGASTTVPKKTFFMPSNRTISSLMFSLTTAQASGSIFTIDIHLDGTTILSTKATIDNTENTTLTATTPYVMTDNTWAQGQKVEVFVDQIGNGSAVELIMYITWN